MSEASRIPEVVESVLSLETEYPVLLTLLRLERMEVEVDREAAALLGRILERDPADIMRLAQWIRGRRSCPTGEVIHRCVSISCTGNGAQKLWQAIEQDMVALGLDTRIHPVHCLSRCEDGPCLALDDDIYLGQTETIHHDDRPWREAPFDQDL